MYLLPLIIITITNLPYPLLLLNPTNKGIECVHRKLNNMLVITPTRWYILPISYYYDYNLSYPL